MSGLVAGFGMRPGAGVASLRDALSVALSVGQTKTAQPPVTALATIAERAENLRALADALTLPLRIVAVSGIQTPTRSDRVLASFGTGSVAEAAALTAAGPDARLVVLRVTSHDGMATCALAQGEGI